MGASLKQISLAACMVVVLSGCASPSSPVSEPADLNPVLVSSLTWGVTNASVEPFAAYYALLDVPEEIRGGTVDVSMNCTGDFTGGAMTFLGLYPSGGPPSGLLSGQVADHVLPLIHWSGGGPVPAQSWDLRKEVTRGRSDIDRGRSGLNNLHMEAGPWVLFLGIAPAAHCDVHIQLDPEGEFSVTRETIVADSSHWQLSDFHGDFGVQSKFVQFSSPSHLEFEANETVLLFFRPGLNSDSLYWPNVTVSGPDGTNTGTWSTGAQENAESRWWLGPPGQWRIEVDENRHIDRQGFADSRFGAWFLPQDPRG